MTITREELRQAIKDEARWGIDGLEKLIRGEDKFTRTFADGLAGIVFAAQLVQSQAESVINHALESFFDRGNVGFKRFDYYDASVEFWAIVGTELTEDEQRILWALGFDRCWVCYWNADETPVIPAQEKYYGKPRESAKSVKGEKP